jgi:hypothetical protein
MLRRPTVDIATRWAPSSLALPGANAFLPHAWTEFHSPPYHPSHLRPPCHCACAVCYDHGVATPRRESRPAPGGFPHQARPLWQRWPTRRCRAPVCWTKVMGQIWPVMPFPFSNFHFRYLNPWNWFKVQIFVENCRNIRKFKLKLYGFLLSRSTQ